MRDAIHVVDADLTILLMNDQFGTWCEELGLELSDPVGKTIFDVFPHLPDRVREEYCQVFDSGQVLTTVEVTELGDCSITTETRKIPVFEAGGVVKVVTVIRDITEQERIRQEKKVSDERIRLLFETIPHALYECDRQGVITLTNSAYSKITGYSTDELVGMHIRELMAPGPQKEEVDSYFEQLAREQPAPTPYLAQNLTKDGQLIDIEVNWNYRLNGEDQVVGFVCILSDITHRKKAETKLLDYQRQLKSLAHQLILARQQEKRHIAELLHEDLGQCLAFCKMKMQIALASVSEAAVADELETACETLTQSMDHIKNLTYELRSPILKELGFDKAVGAWLKEDIEGRHNIKTVLMTDCQTKTMDENLKSLLFRSIRELVTNSVKHANPTQIQVHIKRVDRQISVCVEDDGDGFDAEAQDIYAKKGFGLFSIRERLDYSGGCLELVSLPGQGCKATLNVPAS